MIAQMRPKVKRIEEIFPSHWRDGGACIEAHRMYFGKISIAEIIDDAERVFYCKRIDSCCH